MIETLAISIFFMVGLLLAWDYAEQVRSQRIYGHGLPAPHPSVLAWLLIGMFYLLVRQ